MKPTAAQLRQLRRDNLAWPVALQPVPLADLAVTGCPSEARRTGLFRSRAFLVQVFTEVGGMQRLSINRTEWDERKGNYREEISWDDLQRLKDEAGFGARVAIEVYPPAELVVNVANIRHLWILPIGAERLPFVWKEGR